MFSMQTKLSMAKAILTKSSPFYIQFYVSKFCHLRCKMCNIVESNEGIEPFSNDKIDKIAKNLVKIGAGVVLLTGGEPYLRSDLPEIVKIFKQHKLDVRLQTAGLYHKFDKILECNKLGANDINVSLDSLDEKLSDYLNGVNGSWRKAIMTIAKISREFSPKSSVCALGCVLSPYNIKHIESVLDFATEIGWWLSLVPAHITQKNKQLHFRGYDPYFIFDEEGIENVNSTIQKLKENKKNGALLFDSEDYLNSILSFVKTQKPTWRKNNICDTPNVYFAVKPDASFAPCCDHDYPEKIFIYDDNFPRLYKSKELYNNVKEIARNCPGCNFGSYPEMTLSVRSLSTIFERVNLQFKAGKIMHKSLCDEDFFSIIENIKSKYAIYSQENTLPLRDKKF